MKRSDPFKVFFFINLLEDKLEIFKVKDLVLYLFKLELKVLFDFILGYVSKSFIVIKIFLKKTFKFSLNKDFI